MNNKEITITLTEEEAKILKKALLKFSTNSETGPVEEEIADTIYAKASGREF